MAKEFKHPELKEGEILLGNFKNIDEVGWESKRAGEKTYRTDGSEIENDTYIPVFVKRKELEMLGIDIEGEYNMSLRK